MHVMNVKPADEHGLEDIRAFSGSADQKVLVWNANKGQGDQRGFIRALTGAKGQIDVVYGTALCVFTGSADHLVRKYHALSGVPEITYRGHKGRITALHEDSGILYSGSQDHTVKLWSCGTGDLLFTLENAHANEIMGIQVCEGVLVTGGHDGYAKVWPLSETLFDDWWKMQDGLIKEYCQRYDFDGGGSINDDEEFSGATFNLVFKLGLKIEHSVVQNRIDAVGEVNDDNAWSFEEFIDWFRINFM